MKPDSLNKIIWCILGLLILPTISWSQVIVSGAVYDDKKSPLPGISVVEKGTQNSTQTDLSGMFSLTVSDPNAVLIISFISMVTQEYSLKGETKIKVTLKSDCINDFFDSQVVEFYLNSGVINNPVGGQIKLASPWFLGGVIKGTFGYQTNLHENKFLNAELDLAHYISNCDFNIDFKINYRKVSFQDNFSFKGQSAEVDFNSGWIKIIGGYTTLNIKNIESDKRKYLSGVLIGAGTSINMPTYPTVIVKTSVYKNKIEYQASIEGKHKQILYNIRFYKLDSFNELSVGLGTYLGYKIKRQKS